MKLCIGTSSTKKNQNKSIRNDGFTKPGETCNRWLVTARLAALCCTTREHFSNFQTHFMEQSFCGSDSPHQLPGSGIAIITGETEVSLCRRRSRHARTTRSETNLVKPKTAEVVDDWAAPACVPELLAFACKAQLRKAIRPARGACPASGLDPSVGVPADLKLAVSDRHTRCYIAVPSY